MRLAALALDYDGTLAANGVLEPDARAALEAVRESGVAIVLVTGRILSNLRSVAGDLRFADGIVAENGAVVAFPQTGTTQLLARPPAASFVAELQKRRIPFEAGQCVVEADSVHAALMLGIIRRHELPLVLIFNGGRVMVLPQGVSKASGLHVALRSLRLSEHNTLGIGDAENDHSLLEACEEGLAVEWGSAALKAAADRLVPGAGPSDAAAFLREMAKRPAIRPGSLRGHPVVLGETQRGTPVSLNLGDTNLLIVGDSVSGKSWAAGLIAEQWMQQHYSVCVIDPEGDYRALANMPGAVYQGGEIKPPAIPALVSILSEPQLSAVVDLSQVKASVKQMYVPALLGRLLELRQRTGHPHRIIMDEAHYFLGDGTCASFPDFDAGGYVFVTYRFADIAPKVRPAHSAMISTRLTRPREVAAVLEFAGESASRTALAPVLRDLSIGEAILITPSAEGLRNPCQFRLAPRRTGHVRHRIKYLNIPVPNGKGFVFTENGRPTGDKADTVRDLAVLIRGIGDSILAGHLGRGDISRWIADVYIDQALAGDIRGLERVYHYESLSDVRKALALLIEDRYAAGDAPM